MKIYYSETHRRHNPPFEVFDGGQRVPYLETPDRMDKILTSLGKTDWADITEPANFGLDPILAVHDPGYINFLATAWDEWAAGQTVSKPMPDNPILLPATFALRRRPHKPASLLGRAGYYMMDLSACIVKGTYEAALASANCALSGANFIAGNPINTSTNRTSTAFALCRPPGHHAGKDYAAGYCFINNAAVAANWLSKKGRVALLDIDYHACNGTQDIFYDRSDVLTISIHGDPDYEYPYYAGYVDETGLGDGLNFHYNFPLPSGVDDSAYVTTLEKALDIIFGFSPKFLVVSVGMDIYKNDPLGKFNISTNGIRGIGKHILKLRLPTLAVMEGGYDNQILGRNIVAFLTSLDGSKRI